MECFPTSLTNYTDFAEPFTGSKSNYVQCIEELLWLSLAKYNHFPQNNVAKCETSLYICTYVHKSTLNTFKSILIYFSCS